MTYSIFEHYPTASGIKYRLIESYDRIEFAETVLKTLESVNINYTAYKIISHPHTLNPLDSNNQLKGDIYVWNKSYL